MTPRPFRALCLAVWLAVLPLPAGAVTGQVVDAVSGKPIADAMITIGDQAVRSNAQGGFEITAPGRLVRLRAVGYQRKDVTLAAEVETTGPVALQPFLARALYLSSYGVTSRTLRHAALDIIDHTTVNALVIDVKGDRGLILHDTAIPLAQQAGARKVTFVRDAKELIDSLKARGIYTIARIVVFKDDRLAAARPELAIRKDGKVWRDRESLAWVDPFSRDVWRYNIDIAIEAAALGFDEIQFDYVRFPDTRGLTFSRPTTEVTRVGAISGFLAEARLRLRPHNVFLAADIFGYACWNIDDTEIGQHLEDLAPHVDYVSPMLYPSGYQFGIPGYRNPVAHPQEIVGLSLERAKQRTGLAGLHFRPWLQAFRDYAFGGRVFGAAEIKAQIDASTASKTAGWMLWNPRNQYTDAGLPRKQDGQVTQEGEKERKHGG